MLKKLKDNINAAIGSFLAEARRKYRLHEVSPALFAGVKDFLRGDGKRIRPILFILSYTGYAGKDKAPYKDILRASISLELLHDFFLIHDDIIDKSDTRRGRPALHKFFDSEPLGLVTGDIIFAISFDVMNSFKADSFRKQRVLGEFARSASLTGMGEFLDITIGAKDIGEVPEKDIDRMYLMKTVKYTFELPLLVGAVLAGAPAAEETKLSSIARKTGKAFQIADDLGDVFLDSAATGKGHLADIAESKKTLLARRAYDNLRSADKKLFARLFDKKKKTKSDLYVLKTLIKRSGSAASCVSEARKLLDEATREVASLGMKKTCADGLLRVIGIIGSNLEEIEKRIKTNLF